MKTKSAMISWIGDTDIIDFFHSLPLSLKTQLIGQLPDNKNKANLLEKVMAKNSKNQQSPIKTILQSYGEKISELHLLTNRLAGFFKCRDVFQSFLYENCLSFQGTIIFHDCEENITRITNLSEVYTITQNIISEIKNSCSELFCNLSSGVGSTSTVITILASAYFENFHLLQTYKSTVTEDFLPEDFSTLVLKRSLKTAQSLNYGKIIGHSPAIKSALSKAMKIAPFDYSILLLGPSGTGKSTLAKEIHDIGPRKDMPFEYVNCGSLTPTLLESRLFGHKKGAFTDAIKDSKGAFTTADGGTLFLDEIADCTMEMQTTLLHALQPRDPNKPTERWYRPMGSESEIHSDVRIIAATNKDIFGLIKQNKFREDLYYRLATSTITMPPLANMSDDIPIIADSIMSQINKHNKGVAGYTEKTLSAEATTKLKSYQWAGNVRELQNVLQQASIMTTSNIISAEDLQLHADESTKQLPDPTSYSLERIKDDLERRYIHAAIDITSGNKAKASRLLGMRTPQNLESRIKALNLRINEA